MLIRPNIAIDGPAGSGKSTVSRLVAEKLGYLYIDTGAMYRALTLKALNNALDFDDPNSLTDMAKTSTVELKVDGGQNLKVFLDHKDVTEAIRDPLVSQRASLVARVPEIRKLLVKMQQTLAAGGGVVMEGRDIGTVVLPDAPVKIFLTASPEKRASRRLAELTAKGYNLTGETIQKEINERDRLDSEREADPLTRADDAILINCSAISAEDVARVIISKIGAAS